MVTVVNFNGVPEMGRRRRWAMRAMPGGSVKCTVHLCTASIYQLDGLVRRATSLQLTA